MLLIYEINLHPGFKDVFLEAAPDTLTALEDHGLELRPEVLFQAFGNFMDAQGKRVAAQVLVKQDAFHVIFFHRIEVDLHPFVNGHVRVHGGIGMGHAVQKAVVAGGIQLLAPGIQVGWSMAVPGVTVTDRRMRSVRDRPNGSAKRIGI